MARSTADAIACFGWSQRAWAAPWRAWRAAMRDSDVLPHGLEVGAGAHSSLTPLMLAFTQQVDCSYFDVHQADAIRQLHQRLLGAPDQDRVHYGAADVRALQGRWDVIVMKSVLGGVFRVHNSEATDMPALIERLVRDHLNPGGWLVTLDNGQTALEPLFSRFGARRNGWRFWRHQDFPAADVHHSFGVLSAFTAASRLGWLGHRIDDVLYGVDRLLTPLVRRHAVLLHAYRKPA